MDTYPEDEAAIANIIRIGKLIPHIENLFLPAASLSDTITIYSFQITEVVLMDKKGLDCFSKHGTWTPESYLSLRHIAHEGIQLFGEESVCNKKERRQWKIFQNSYETLSRTRQIPLIGSYLFSILEKIQNISTLLSAS